MQINVTCERHNVSMVVVREWTSRGDIEVTVEPCPECIEEAAEQLRAGDGADDGDTAKEFEGSTIRPYKGFPK